MQSLQSSLSAPRRRRFTINSQLTAESTPRRREPILAYDSRRKVGRYAASEVVKNVGIRLERCCELFEHSIRWLAAVVFEVHQIGESKSAYHLR